MPGFSSVISNNVLANHIISLAGKQVQGIGVFDDINARNNLSGGDGNSTSRVDGFLALVKDADGSGTTKAYIFIGGDSGDPDQGDYVGDSAWTNASNWKEISTFTEVSQDTTPQLGGNLDVNGNSITSTSNGNITIDPNGTGNVLIGNFTFDADQSVGAGQDGYVLTHTDGSGISLQPSVNTDTKINNVRDNDTSTIITDVTSIRFTGGLCAATGTTGIATVSVGGTINRLTDVDDTISAAAGDVLIYNATSSKYEPQNLTAGSNITITNGDGSITIAADQRTQEEIEDFVSGLIVGGEDITVTYNDTAGTLTIDKDTTTSYYPSTTGLDTDGEASGEIVYIGQSGDNLTAGSVYYYTSSGSWQAADADAVSTASGLIGMALGTNPTTAGVLLRGYGVSSSNLGTVGSVVYLSTNAGEVTETAPSGNGDVVRVMGYTLNATSDLMYFNPSPDWIELTV
jgi:hypothetical protein|tara:strand:- start:6655 stop:8028 length:1374 start_codon:yes stop_codon:yes gene_type:complete